MSLILASSSPFRKVILEKLGVAFVTASPDIDEARYNGETPYDLVLRLAAAKAKKVAKLHSGLIIASDQVATFGLGTDKADEILTKPLTHENAFKQLRKSSGRTINFLTSIALLNTETSKLQNHVEFFQVLFKTLSDNQIRSYLEKENVLNCAGSFKSEGLGIALFRRMKGDDPNSLIGLPTIKLVDMLAKENVHIL
ncbi:MAG TPA: Maf family nucleotide pyrophosphatase [Gammaproteobacteria bacterium]|nr:Maf family nucleotide pyrophosphatase [Gammaproteobacteria bacterium]